KNDGTLYTYGINGDGELGNGTTTDANTPAQISGFSGVAGIQSGVTSSHTLALKSDGTLWSWGDNANGQLGIGFYGPVSGTNASPTGSKAPVQVQGLGLTGGVTITALACGKNDSVALKSDGPVIEWGDLSYQPRGFS